MQDNAMEDQFSRTRMLLGPSAIDVLRASRVAVFGVGGVGGYAVEVLARSGVGLLDLFDNDRVSLTNLNRQLIALHSTLGRYKVDVAAERIRDINPSCRVRPFPVFYLPENADQVDLTRYDYVVDCIDTVKAKMELARRCHALGIPLISSMGAANKLDPTAFRVSDLSKTQMDPLAKIMRTTLRREGIRHLKFVYSEEPPLRPLAPSPETSDRPDATPDGQPAQPRRQVPASNAFVPGAAGLIIGGEVVKDLISRAQTMQLAPEPSLPPQETGKQPRSRDFTQEKS